MDVNHINPILKAFSDVLPQIGFKKIERLGLSKSGTYLINQGVICNIGVVGKLKGSIVFGMDMDSAKRFASTMMMGMAVTEFDDMASSAIAEMSNMVCANACTNFVGMDIKGLDISPPTVIVGKGGSVRLAAPILLIVKYNVDNINVDLAMGLF